MALTRMCFLFLGSFFFWGGGGLLGGGVGLKKKRKDHSMFPILSGALTFCSVWQEPSLFRSEEGGSVCMEILTYTYVRV